VNSKAPPAKSAEELEVKRMSVIMLRLTTFSIESFCESGTLGDQMMKLADQIVADLHHQDCWGEFKAEPFAFVDVVTVRCMCCKETSPFDEKSSRQIGWQSPAFVNTADDSWACPKCIESGIVPDRRRK